MIETESPLNQSAVIVTTSGTTPTFTLLSIEGDPDPQYAQFDPDVTVSDTPVAGLLLE
jgi:hypothetical protein